MLRVCLRCGGYSCRLSIVLTIPTRSRGNSCRTPASIHMALPSAGLQQQCQGLSHREQSTSCCSGLLCRAPSSALLLPGQGGTESRARTEPLLLQPGSAHRPGDGFIVEHRADTAQQPLAISCSHNVTACCLCFILTSLLLPLRDSQIPAALPAPTLLFCGYMRHKSLFLPCKDLRPTWRML